MTTDRRDTGSIKKLCGERGFGFLSLDYGNDDVFFHASNVTGTSFDDLREGDQVSFIIGEGRDRRPTAHDVRLLRAEP
jgi:CspA family cold shock protein